LPFAYALFFLLIKENDTVNAPTNNELFHEKF